MPAPEEEEPDPSTPEPSSATSSEDTSAESDTAGIAPVNDVTPAADELTEPALTPEEESAPSTGVQDLSPADQAAPVAADDPEADETAELEENVDDEEETEETAAPIGDPITADSPEHIATSDDGVKTETPLFSETQQETGYSLAPVDPSTTASE